MKRQPVVIFPTSDWQLQRLQKRYLHQTLARLFTSTQRDSKDYKCNIDNALLEALIQKKEKVDSTIIDQVATDLRLKKSS